MSYPPGIEKLATNNHMPSDEEVQELKGLLIGPIKDLQDLDAEILDLRNRLSELESKRTEMSKEMSRLSSILSPIRRIPPDVLGEIFYHCLPTHRNPIMRCDDCPLLLGRVCSPWRTVAMSHPRLWERIYITFTDNDEAPDIETAAQMARDGQIENNSWRSARTKLAKQHVTETLRRRYEAFRDWIMRSGTRPLSISLIFDSTFWYNIPYTDNSSGASMQFLSFLASLSPRLKDFEVRMSRKVYGILEDMMKVSEMKALTSFRVECYDHSGNADPSPLMLLNAPNLRKISICGNGFPDQKLASNKLTSISCFNSLPVADVILMLEACQNLVHCKVMVSDYSLSVPMVYSGHIYLPFLQTLSITEYQDPRCLGNVFDCIDAPVLRWINYNNHVYVDTMIEGNSSTLPIVRLLQKSTTLRTLIIDSNDFAMQAWDLGAVLGAVPSITHLVLGPRHKPGPALPPFDANYHTSGTLDGSPWGFTDLIINDHDDSPLLPNLKSLAIWSPAVNITDQILFDVVKSRMTRGLEDVSVVFCRESEGNDIIPELLRHAELVGVNIDLELDYLQPPAPPEKPSSAEYGLGGLHTAITGLDGRSWLYVDADEHSP